MTRIKLLLVMCVVVTGIVSATDMGYEPVKLELDQYFQEQTDNGNFNGAALVARDGKILLRKGFGMADFTTGRENNQGTIFAIASLSKAFAAVGLIMLEERGLIDYDDPVDLYIPEYSQAHTMTVHQLMNMSAGPPNFLVHPDLWANIHLYYEPHELLQYFMYEPVSFPAGTDWEYCNSCYLMMGLIIERVTGQTFGQFMHENVCAPLKMTKTFYDPYDQMMMNHRALPYDNMLTNPPPISPYLHASAAYSAGGMFSNITDMYKWDQALYDDTLISYESLERMITPGHGNYGYGWWIDTMNIGGVARRHVWHFGSYLGYHSYFSRLVDDRVTVILLLNYTSPDLMNSDQLKPHVIAAANIALGVE